MSEIKVRFPRVFQGYLTLTDVYGICGKSVDIG